MWSARSRTVTEQPGNGASKPTMPRLRQNRSSITVITALDTLAISMILSQLITIPSVISPPAYWGKKCFESQISNAAPSITPSLISSQMISSHFPHIGSPFYDHWRSLAHSLSHSVVGAHASGKSGWSFSRISDSFSASMPRPGTSGTAMNPSRISRRGAMRSGHHGTRRAPR